MSHARSPGTPPTESRGDAFERLARLVIGAGDDVKVGWQVDAGLHPTETSWWGAPIEYVPQASAWSECGFYRVDLTGDVPDEWDPAELMRGRRRKAERGIMDVSAVAERLDVKPQSVRAYLARGLMPEPYGRFGQSPVWREADIEVWIASRPGQGNRTPRR